MAGMLVGRADIEMGNVATGLDTLDAAMLPVSSGECSPLVCGLIYCSVIDACRAVYAFDRGREWTDALAAWCATQPQLVTFSGTCMAHRAEILQMQGAWTDAIAEADRASASLSARTDPQDAAFAHYQKGEVLRLRGSFDEAEKAFVAAAAVGGDALPGLALLRLGQGRTTDAAAGIRRALSATQGRLPRARILPAAIEILLAAHDIETAQTAADELRGLATHYRTEVLAAMADHAEGAVRLAREDAAGAMEPLRRASATWLRMGAPYLAARPRVLAGLACRALGDEEGAKVALRAARSVFAELGATPDVARIDRLLAGARQHGPDALTAREVEVLLQVAAGRTNKAIAADLLLSEKTVDRHVSNIFNKLGVPTRAAATAYAYEHGLVPKTTGGRPDGGG